MPREHIAVRGPCSRLTLVWLARWFDWRQAPRTLINCLNIGSQRANKRRENGFENKKHPAYVARTIMQNPCLIYR